MLRNYSVLLFFLGIFLTSCTTTEEEQKQNKDTSKETPVAERIQILCTTNIIADVTRHVLSPDVDISCLMGPGVDPHLYVPTRSDLKAMRRADIILYNGLHLEGKMVQALEGMAKNKTVLPLGRYAPKEQLIGSKGEGRYDPHIWFDIPLWLKTWEGVLDSLKNEGVPLHPGHQHYFDSLRHVHRKVKQILQKIPQAHRYLVTTHDAFSYYARNYQLKVKALQGISTLSEFGLSEINELSAFLVENKLPAVFLEPTVPKRYLEALKEKTESGGHQIELVYPLYADALGPPDIEAGTYIGMIRDNSEKIYEALKH